MNNDDLGSSLPCKISRSQKRRTQQQKKHDARKRKHTSPGVAHFSLIDDHFFDRSSFFFASKPLSLRLFSAAFVKNNLVCKLVSLVFSRSVQRDTRREEEEEEGRRGRRVLWW
jgi:hypothetical protein